MQRFSVPLSNDLYEALVAESQERGVSPTRLAAVLLEQGLAERLETLGPEAEETAPPGADNRLLEQYLACEDDRAWGQMYALLEEMPEALASSALVRQQHGFALNRDGRDEEAEQVLRQVLDAEGPSAETYGILGRVFKDRWDAHRGVPGTALLEQAIETYLKGHDADPGNPYPGINALTLMSFLAAPPERRAALLQDLQDAVLARSTAVDRNYWDHATRIELAVHLGDEKAAAQALAGALASDKVEWMIETTLRNLRLLREARDERAAREAQGEAESAAGDATGWGEPLPVWLDFIEAALAGALAPEAGAAATDGGEPEDLQKIEGIGPKIAGLLEEAGIDSYARLARADVDRLQAILDAAGFRYRLADPTTWPEQASLAAAGRWSELEVLQEELLGGRRPGDLLRRARRRVRGWFSRRSDD